MEGGIHSRLKRCRCIRQAFYEHPRLKMTKRSAKSSLRSIFMRNQNLMISRCQINEVKYFEPDTASRRSSILGIVRRFLIVIEFKAR
jgi:hypothetical protein